MHARASPITVIGCFMLAACWRLERLPEPAGKGLAVAVGCRRLGASTEVLPSISEGPG